MSNMKSTASRSSNSGLKTVYWMPPRSSEISTLSSPKVTPTHIRDWLISLRRASRANRSASLASSGEKTTPGTCGLKPANVLAEYNPATSYWRTSQVSLLTNMQSKYSERLPNWGMILDGVLSGLTPPVLPTRGKGCGWWPTPTSRDYKGARLPETLKASGRGESNSLPDKVLAVQMRISARRAIKPFRIKGTLNPDWVEWLMGWPIGWTSLDPLKEARILSWERDPADNGDIPRTAVGIKDRIPRIKTIGNGQVSACIAMAWKIL